MVWSLVLLGILFLHKTWIWHGIQTVAFTLSSKQQLDWSGIQFAFNRIYSVVITFWDLVSILSGFIIGSRSVFYFLFLVGFFFFARPKGLAWFYYSFRNKFLQSYSFNLHSLFVRSGIYSTVRSLSFTHSHSFE